MAVLESHGLLLSAGKDIRDEQRIIRPYTTYKWVRYVSGAALVIAGWLPNFAK